MFLIKYSCIGRYDRSHEDIPMKATVVGGAVASFRRPSRPEGVSCPVRVLAWSFVYVFFSNGTPFDAPNRSEPCPSR